MSDAQILLQAGHDGMRRNGGGSLDPRNAVPSYGTTGTVPERELTPQVARRAATKLTAGGFSVIVEDAFYSQRYDVDLALSLHFDGSSPACASKASVGYPPGVPIGSNRPTAELWKQIYGAYWPFGFMPDNFTKNLSGYYGYQFTSTTIAEILIEFGEITCPDQDEWLLPRIDWLGDLVAHFASRVVDPDNCLPDPGPWPDNPALEELRRAELHAARLTRTLGRLARHLEN